MRSDLVALSQVLCQDVTNMSSVGLLGPLNQVWCVFDDIIRLDFNSLCSLSIIKRYVADFQAMSSGQRGITPTTPSITFSKTSCFHHCNFSTPEASVKEPEKSGLSKYFIPQQGNLWPPLIFSRWVLQSTEHFFYFKNLELHTKVLFTISRSFR